MLLFAEAALVLIVLERFLRVILASEATEDDTLPNLLEKATSARLCMLKLPAADRAQAIREIKNVRNTILHGNYEQAARQAGCSSVTDYFKRQFAPEIERLFQITDHLMAQIDPSTGNALT